MMTVFVLNRIENERARAAVCQRYWTPLLRVEPGGATPGRGGRRKRRRAASEWREINAWDHYDALELLRRSSMRRNVRREVPLKEAGYRERRRLAKLRRRRVRAARQGRGVTNAEVNMKRGKRLAKRVLGILRTSCQT